MSDTERWHQSYSKTLLNECPGILRHRIDEGWQATRDMNIGSVIDQMVFGQRNYHTVSTVYKSGARKGEPVTSWTAPAKAEAAEAEERGQVAVLASQVDWLEEVAGFVKSELLMRGVDLDDADVVVQKKVRWTAPDGTECEGEPDIIIPKLKLSIDLKCGAEMNPKRVRKQVWDMCYDVQGASYLEAYDIHHGGSHWIARASTKAPLMFTAYALSGLALAKGRERRDVSRAIWNRCKADNVWPFYPDQELDPPEYELRRWDERNAA